jgi:hypothetical protein
MRTLLSVQHSCLWVRLARRLFRLLRSLLDAIAIVLLKPRLLLRAAKGGVASCLSEVKFGLRWTSLGEFRG